MTNREIDVLIAEKVYGAEVTFLNQKHGWRVDYVSNKDECNDPNMTDWGADGYRLKRFSQDMNSAWQVVTYLCSKGLLIELSNEVSDGHTDWWCYAELANSGLGSKTDVTNASTGSEAICIAILKAYGVII